jgi:hypothetical protein
VSEVATKKKAPRAKKKSAKPADEAPTLQFGDGGVSPAAIGPGDSAPGIVKQSAPVEPATQAPVGVEKPTGPRDYVFVRQVTTQYTYRVSAKTRVAAKRWVDSCSADAADEKNETRSVFLSQKEKKKPTAQLGLFGDDVP